MCPRGKAPLRLLVADQHRIVRAGIRVMLTEARSGTKYQLDETETSTETLTKLRSQDYDVVLIAYDLPGLGGIKTTELITQRKPGTPVICLMQSPERSATERIIRAGASGCILTSIEPDTLEAAIRTVTNSQRFYSNDIAIQLLEPLAPAPSPVLRLTRREQDIFRCLLSGLKHHEIAAHLGISKRTVDKHRQHLNTKLGVRNAVQLVQVGQRLGLISEHT